MDVDALKKYELGSKYANKGTCESELFFNEESNFAIYDIRSEEGNFILKGCFPSKLKIGFDYQVEGIVEEYKERKQVKLKAIIQCKPVGKDGVIAYLKTLYGLKKRAEKIYEVFGDDSIDILIENPMQVCNAISGIGKKSVAKWQEQLKELSNERYAFMKLLDYGLTEKNAINLLKKYGIKVIEIIEENPYILMREVSGYSFLKCDEIALNNNVKFNDSNRIECGIIHILEQMSYSGNCYEYEKELIKNSGVLLALKLNVNQIKYLLDHVNSKYIKCTKNKKEYSILREDLEIYIEEYLIMSSPKEKKEHRYVLDELSEGEIKNAIISLIDKGIIIKEDDRIYLSRLYNAEVSLSNKISELLEYNNAFSRKKVEKILDEICKEKGFILEDKQREACIEFNTTSRGLCLLLGSAGTGKTFTLNLILQVSKRLLEEYKDDILDSISEDEENKNKQEILVVAPTGKAAKVASKTTGMDCLTIHRALGFNIDGFEKDSSNPFTEKNIVSDEASMIDIVLAKDFFSAISFGTKIILLGDIKQLPSVGPGNVLKDLIESKKTRAITLNVPKRQDKLSDINLNANRVIQGKMIQNSTRTNDFYILEKENVEDVQKTVIASAKRMLERGIEMSEIQVLSPQKTGQLGTYMFNYMLQREFNYENLNEIKVFKTKFEIFKGGRKESIKMYLHIKDKVMHTKNNYSMDLYNMNEDGVFLKLKNRTVTNGECGIIYSIEKIEGSKKNRIIVKYDDFYAFYENGVEELELSYAMTIHKAQGSGFKGVIIPIVKQHTIMLSNNILYTAITRSKELCAIVGQTAAIKRAITTKNVMKRNTTLKERIISIKNNK